MTNETENTQTEVTISSEIERLRSECLALREFMPLAIGIRSELKLLINLTNQKTHRAIYFICHHRTYLKNISVGGSRHYLDGSIAGEITEAEKENALAKLTAHSKS